MSICMSFLPRFSRGRGNNPALSAFPHLSHLGPAPDFAPVPITLAVGSRRGPAPGTAPPGCAELAPGRGNAGARSWGGALQKQLRAAGGPHHVSQGILGENLKILKANPSLPLSPQPCQAGSPQALAYLCLPAWHGSATSPCRTGCSDAQSTQVPSTDTNSALQHNLALVVLQRGKTAPSVAAARFLLQQQPWGRAGAAGTGPGCRRGPCCFSYIRNAKSAPGVGAHGQSPFWMDGACCVIRDELLSLERHFCPRGKPSAP